MEEKDLRREAEEQTPQPWTPASFDKRAAAWMGIVYVLMLLFVLNFTLYSGGRELPGTFPLFLVPVCATLAVITGRRLKKGIPLPGGVPGGVIALAGCVGGTALGLLFGAPPLAAALGG